MSDMSIVDLISVGVELMALEAITSPSGVSQLSGRLVARLPLRDMAPLLPRRPGSERFLKKYVETYR